MTKITKKEYIIKDFDEKSIVYEVQKQKDILEFLDEKIYNVEELGSRWDYIFADDTFYIEYANGTTFCAGFFGYEGVYKKKGIKRIIYVNAHETMVYGAYDVNEYGNVS